MWQYPYSIQILHIQPLNGDYLFVCLTDEQIPDIKHRHKVGEKRNKASFVKKIVALRLTLAYFIWTTSARIHLDHDINYHLYRNAYIICNIAGYI